MIARLTSFALVLGLLVGCQPATVTTPASTVPPPNNGKGDVHVHTPRVNVDVEKKGTGRTVDVNVKRNDP